MTKNEKGQSQGPRGHLAAFKRIAKSTRAERVRMPDLARASRSAGHGHVIATGPCLPPIDTLSRAVLKLTTGSDLESRQRPNGFLPRVLDGRWEGGLVSLVVPHAFLVTCRRPCTHSPPPNSTHQMDNFKRGYKQAKGKVKDLLRPPSRQSVLTTPARSPRISQEPSATHDQGNSSTPSVIVPASQTAIGPTAVDPPGADVPALEAPAPESSPQPGHTPGAASTYTQPPSPTDNQGISTAPSAIDFASQTAIVSTAIATPRADVPAVEAPTPEPPRQPGHTPDVLSTSAQPPSVISMPATMSSVCNELLTVLHGASDAFPPLKSALVEILESWNRCEVRKSQLHDFLCDLTALSDDHRS